MTEWALRNEEDYKKFLTAYDIPVEDGRVTPLEVYGARELGASHA